MRCLPSAAVAACRCAKACPNFRAQVGRPSRPTDGILLLYSVGIGPVPATILDSITAFRRHSRFRIWPLNAFYGFPAALRQVRPRVIALHYTMFYDQTRPLEEPFLELLDRCSDSYLIAMFQDEQAYLDRRLELCRRYRVDCVYTMMGPEAAQRTYGAETPASRIVSHIPGYVSDELRERGRALAKPDRARAIDIGYRGRKAPDEWGPAVREKYAIAVGFERRARGSDLRLDIETDEDKRIYGDAWYRFIADCRATLGTESGTEIPWGPEGELLPYRTISPRHLEAAALGSCQILFEGRYSDMLEPMVHYIPLRKDFSNFDEVLARYRDADLRRELTANAHRNLIEDERATYRRFIADFDRNLEQDGVTPYAPGGSRVPMLAAVVAPRPRRRLRALISRMLLRLRAIRGGAG